MNEVNKERQAMVCGQVMPNKVTNEAVLNSLSTVPRENFVPKAMRSLAYVDSSIEVADGRYAMDAMILAKLMQAANIERNDLVLVVGGASGYEAAVLAQCVDAVVCLEEDAQLIERSTQNLLNFGVDNVAVVEGVLASGVKGQGPFEVIFINGAVEFIPPVLLNQLSDGGRLVCIMISDGIAHGHLVIRQGSEFISRDIFEGEGALLPGFEITHGFVFP